MTATYEDAVAELEQKLEPLRAHRANVIAVVQRTIDQVSVSKSWRNVTAAADDCRLAFKALDDYRDILGKLELSVAIKAGGMPAIVKSKLAELRITDSLAPLYRVLGDEATQRESFARVERILKSPPRREIRKAPFSRVYKLYADSRRDVAQRVDWTNPAINEEAMSVTLTICTDAVDREQEVIVPSGVDLTHYRKNPIVLFEHGMDSSFPCPIARCETPDGRLALTVTAHSIVATAYFIRDDADSMKVWNLVRQGAMRAASIHVMPTVAPVRRVVAGQNATIYPKSSMTEWSICRIGCNPTATM